MTGWGGGPSTGSGRAGGEVWDDGTARRGATRLGHGMTGRGFRWEALKQPRAEGQDCGVVNEGKLTGGPNEPAWRHELLDSSASLGMTGSNGNWRWSYIGMLGIM